MKLKVLTLPFFISGLILINLRGLLIVIFFPLLKHRFFSLSLFLLLIYLAIFGQALIYTPPSQTIKITNYSEKMETLPLHNFTKFTSLKEKIVQIIQLSGGTTNLYLNLGLLAYYQNQRAEADQAWARARQLDPNHPIFQQ